MKNVMSLLIAALISVGISQAQERAPRQNRSPEESAKMQVERLTAELTLNQSQQDSIYKYSLLARTEQRKLMETAGDNKEEGFEKMRTIRENSDKKIKSFLTKEQEKKYDELIKNRQQHRSQRGN